MKLIAMTQTKSLAHPCGRAYSKAHSEDVVLELAPANLLHLLIKLGLPGLIHFLQREVFGKMLPINVPKPL